VDVNEVTFVDKIGERMLRTMANQGAQFVAHGAGMERVLERLRSIEWRLQPWAYNRMHYKFLCPMFDLLWGCGASA
jgi:hypothetical protein